MDDNIHKLIAAISPDVYCQKEEEKDGEVINIVKKVKEKIRQEGYSAATKEVKVLKPVDLPPYDYDKAKEDALNLWGLKSPMEQHTLIYDSPTEAIEPVYFWLLDFIGGPYRNIEKITDNFVSSPGSGHFSELQGKASQMQQEASRTMGNVNTVLKSVLNLVYDLKEFRLRLKPYNIYLDKKTDDKERYSQLLSLKQIWLDNVDIRKGRGSINALSAGELDFVTLRDAFMAVSSLEKVDSLDLNERVKRILKQRAQEFFSWIDESYSSLKQRFEIERNYLKSQVNMLKMYAKWVKPYLVAAQKLQQNFSSKNAALVSAFNTTIFELKLMATSEYDIVDDVNAGALPDLFKKVKTRKYNKVLIVELEFRSIPQKVSQRGDYAFGGRAEIKFTSYALNNDELDVLRKELDKDDLNSMLKLVEDATDNSLSQISKEIRALTEGKEEEDIEKEDKKKKEEEEERKKPKGDDFGFKAFFSSFKFKKKEEKKDLTKGIAPDDEYEKVIRSQTILSANQGCFLVFDVYKKSHGMASHNDPYDAI